MGRHDSPDRTGAVAVPSARRPAVVALAIALVVLLVAALALVWQIVRPGGDATLASASCTEPQTLRVIADPLIAPALQQIATDTEDSRCALVEVTAQSSAEAAAAVALSAEPAFDIWIPDSLLWYDRAAKGALEAGLTTVGLRTGDRIATSPIVVAATEDAASDLDLTESGWSAIASREVSAVLPDPSTNAASVAGLLALRDSAAAADARNFTSTILELDRRVVPTAEEAFAALPEADAPTVAVTSEAQVSAHNANSDDPIVAIYPDDGTAALSFDMVRPQGESAVTKAAVYEFQAAVASSLDTLGENGLRGPGGEGSPADTGSEAANVDIEQRTAYDQGQMTKTWSVLTAPSRMLNVIDVSGSMADATATGRRIDIYQDAAVLAVKSLSAESTMSTWIFSTNRVGDQDWQELLPFGSLGDEEFLQSTVSTVQGLDSQVGGATGLYDTVLASVQYMRSTYDPDRVNLVLLATDGRNEDASGIDLPTLVSQLNALNDPAKPVPVILIGYGPDTDQTVMAEIARATDGAYYQALQPADIGPVLLDATVQRGCRPNCGGG